MKAVGRDAATKKYDVLTALAVMALAQADDRHRQRQVLRMIALVTARYNWQRDELSVGQAEIARLWSVDLRTVKREMARLRAQGWLVEKVAAARGRVAVHGIDLAVILADTRPHWALVGPDFEARLSGPEAAAVTPGNVVPFPQALREAAASPLWAAVAAEFGRIAPAVHAAWIAPLTEAGVEGGTLVLQAPSRFHGDYVMTHLADQLRALLRRLDGRVRDLRVVA